MSLGGHENPLGLPGRSKRSSGLPVRQRIPGVGKVLLVSSGKGGVGKSTMSVNLALAMSQLGQRVGILDADVFGPSLPTLVNLSGEPRINSKGQLIPLVNYGVQTMSMGYLIKQDNPVVWRGLMVMKAMQQLLFEVAWDNVDVLVVDMPPGTGDTQLSIGQQVKIDGSIIVSTPQDIALIDAVKGVSMFEKMRIPILGLVQNMAYYHCPNCHHEDHIFGPIDGAIKMAEKKGLRTLGSIPLNSEICAQSDKGKPIVLNKEHTQVSKPYFDISKEVLQLLKL
ncbi:Mrp/NBP35 family ATP-binding protein [Cyberlindnera jadinii NRRL Y-1542]|uniref:p-loop containing nucleoside triphosphate hydrolase protein n=1 Tax=Cyberlindnera jadinii (strain ATCC 18201 / CBS 1600 / BCRC 20928 / JCM 3617 / NBRC 0987 / NRRL Y-1542) TaxID=983966 RepID=A0A1E4S432_CYBJN|nr:P-loop containing nucleoside triphosphate hydrolase protein [Cyberlindnera jadinii NRRL Y-1542]ODV74289.1 P-loop containing nucleoside triphosphate hydrolase protein [Cyberlindnera jadinii NRRL Y-1542]